MERLVHLSIDDVGPSLRYLIHNWPSSLFDLRFYGKLREWHQRFGARFCLYCFSRMEDFAISEIPEQYVKDFQESGNWLRFGFHGRGDMPFALMPDFREEFKLFQETAHRLGMAGTDILRVHYWHAAPEQQVFLREQGIRFLLSPNEPGLPYGADGMFFENGLGHRRTDVRFEHLSAVDEESLRIGAEQVVAFTHEWAFDRCAPIIEEALAFYKSRGYAFC